VKTEARVFLLIALFAWICAAGYAYWTGTPQSYTGGKVEPVGVAALVLSGGLMGIPGSFFWFISRRIDARPEDRPDADISEAAGELGFFSPGSYWPIGIAASGTVIGLGAAFVQVWLMLVGVLLVLFTVGGLLFEYYLGGTRIHPRA